MRYLSFDIKNYRAISALTVKLGAKLIRSCIRSDAGDY